MEAYRDQYATLFNNGRNVTVIGISVDADTTLASWAREEDFPIVFASDPGGKVGQA
ncbi:MAG: peroxiredoxin family protein, partial [Gemmatimonadaceae bacterium]